MAKDDDGRPTPTVGMGATEYMWSDRKPFTIIHVASSGRRCTVRSDRYKRTDSNGMSDVQTYEYEPDPDGEIVTLRLTKNGWTSKGRRFGIGHRRAYHDFSF